VTDDVVPRQLEFVEQQPEHVVGDVVLHLEPHGTAEAAAAQLELDRRQEILGVLVVERQVGVAGDAEDVRVLDLHASKQPVQVRAHHVLDEDQPIRCFQREEPRQSRRELDPCESPFTRERVPHHHRQIQGEIRDVREWMRRIDRQRREDGEDSLIEQCSRCIALSFVGVAPRDHDDSCSGECRQQTAAPELLLARNEQLGPLGDLLQLAERRSSVGRWRRHVRRDLVLQGRDAYLEEFVEVARDDRGELAALEERRRRLLGEDEHPLVEVKPAQFAVEVPLIHG